MADEKPARLGKLDKPSGRKFAPKKPAKKAPKRVDAAGASTSGAGESSDAFKDLMDQAKLAGKGMRRQAGAGRGRGNADLQVAFGGGVGGGPSFASNPTIRQGVLDPVSKASGSGGGGSGGGGGGSGIDAAGKAGAKSGGGGGGASGSKAKVEPGFEGMDPNLPGSKFKQPYKPPAIPFLDDHRYFPTMVPFADVNMANDPASLFKSAIPKDLSLCEVEAEGNTAAALNLDDSMADGTMTLLQLPSLLPCHDLLSNAKEAATVASTSGQEPSTGLLQPLFMKGAEPLRTIQPGKIGTLKVMKSGKVRLQIGDIEYVVTESVPSKACTEAHWVNTGSGDVVFMGGMHTHAVAALDMEALIKRMQNVLPACSSTNPQ